MTGLIVLGLVVAGFTALAVYLDHIGFDPFASYRTDPRDLVKRAHEWSDQ